MEANIKMFLLEYWSDEAKWVSDEIKWVWSWSDLQNETTQQIPSKSTLNLARSMAQKCLLSYITVTFNQSQGHLE